MLNYCIVHKTVNCAFPGGACKVQQVDCPTCDGSVARWAMADRTIAELRESVKKLADNRMDLRNDMEKVLELLISRQGTKAKQLLRKLIG